MSEEMGPGRPPRHGGFEPVRGTAGARAAADRSGPASASTGQPHAATAAPFEHDDNEVAHARGRRSRALAVILIIVFIVILAGIGALAAVLVSRAGTNASQPTVTVTVTAAPPTASATPVDVPAGSDFWNALPHTVGAFALEAADPAAAGSSPILNGGSGSPLEAYTWTYGDGDQQIVLTATQWATTDEATAAFTAATANSGVTPETVTVGGTPVGSMVRTTSDDQGAIVWSNGTALFQASGPREAVDQFCGQFPY